MQPECSFKGCDRPSNAKTLCRTHYEQQRSGRPLSVIGKWTKSDRDRGTGWYDQDGYVVVRVNGRPIREHRYIMQQHLGRPLLPEETVHHLNGDRSDNRIENLELWSTSQPPGQRVEDKLEWARQIIALYA